MSNPPVPPLPLPDDDRVTSDGDTEPEIEDPEITRPDGERILDRDLDDALIDSAAADRLASGADPVQDVTPNLEEETDERY